MAQRSLYFANDTSPHAQETSTSTSDVKTLTPPAGAHGVFLTVTTNGCTMTFDASTPSSSNGLAFPKDGVPAFFPLGTATIKFISQAAGNSVVNALWVR